MEILTLCILMDFPIHACIDTLSIRDCQICTLKLEFSEFWCVLKVCYDFSKQCRPGKMQHYAAFHLGLCCLQQYPFRGLQFTMG